jgi:hypothetical protein
LERMVHIDPHFKYQWAFISWYKGSEFFFSIFLYFK